MTALTTYHLFSADIPPPATWALLRWCLRRGADEFSLSLMSMQGSSEPECDRVRRDLAPWSKGRIRRPALNAEVESDGTRLVELWRLAPECIEIMPRFLEAGLLEYFLDPEKGWVEDPHVYRGGDLMLGVVSHEQEGILRVTPAEREELSSLGILVRDKGAWVNYAP